jgi:CHASE3 domain sensor protein
MNTRVRRFVSFLGITWFGVLAALPARAQTESRHVVSEPELNRAVQHSAESRPADQAAIRRLLSSEAGQQALHSARVDYQKIDQAISQLSDQDLAKLAERSRQAENDFAAGLISAKHFAELILVLVVIIVIIVLV